MDIRILKPRKALNKAFMKVKPKRSEIDGFKSGLTQLLDRIDENETEEFHKNLVRDFLKITYYEPNHFINTKGRNDLVIHHSNSASAKVDVIIEAKKPSNRTEMVSKEKLNVKAFHELVLYYLRERISQKNIEIKYLIATSIYEWFIFDATLFERLFAQNKNLVKQYHDFENGRLADTKTDFFYKQVAEPFIREIKQEIECTWFDIRDYEKALRNADKKDDNQLIALFKLLSPEHLLKLPFANDSNSLDRRFYSELLHLIGLSETKEGARKLIGRNKEGERHSGSLIENAIIQLDMLDKIPGLKNLDQYGTNQQERLFNVALELAITWINRILFLKLLEAQLVKWHRGDKSFEFLNISKISDYDNLNSLFFQVLARKPQDRHEDVKTAFSRVPYLNSSLFEPSEIEKASIFVSNLRNDKPLPIFPATVLKDRNEKKRTGRLNPLEYLFEFLNAYDFASEGSEEIQEENKTLINASVLGLIFEKINGYRDGSFFTPGFITMYMCRETIRKAVVQKFNETKNWNCTNLDELYDKIDDRNEANRIINDIKICDPAVGSGHFLVSALNEIIAVKNDLKILQDRQGRRLKEYHVEVVNDELVVTDEEGKLFEYHPANRESQRIQETLFHEKQEIIENCLFGVDINPNSVKICQLRLWIELLKNAYYKHDSNSSPLGGGREGVLAADGGRKGFREVEGELETLPNIDINIKCGNSLVSRFALDADLKKALKGSRYDITAYRLAVQTYRNTRSKEVKREMEQLIERIKAGFRSEISQNDPRIKRLNNLNGELFNLSNQGQLFERTKKEKAEWSKKVEKLTTEIRKLETEIEETKANKIFEHSFEWRFEFPEVLNEEGDFVGFDVVIGNPPYGMISKGLEYFSNSYKTIEGRFDLFEAFIEKGLLITKAGGITIYILPNTLLTNLFSQKVRKNLLDNFHIAELTNFGMDVFEEATVHTCIIGIVNTKIKSLTKIRQKVWSKEELDFRHPFEIEIEKLVDQTSLSINLTLSLSEINIFTKVSNHKPLSEICHIRQCIKTGNDEIYVKKSMSILEEPWKKSLRGKSIDRYQIIEKDLYLKYGDFLARNWQNKSFYETPKIAVRETGNRIIATVDFENRYFLSTVYAIYPKEKFGLDFLKFILGILNSKFASFYIKKIAYDLTDGAFTKVRTNQLGRLPVPSFKNIGEMISKKVDEVLISKSSISDTFALEAEIDQLVYRLYGLTPEEIEVIENGVK